MSKSEYMKIIVNDEKVYTKFIQDVEAANGKKPARTPQRSPALEYGIKRLKSFKFE